jgi:hypothetical protein
LVRRPSIISGLNALMCRDYLAQQPQPASQQVQSSQQQLEPEQQPQQPPQQQHDEAQQAHEQEQPAPQPLAATAVVEEPTPENESMAADMRAMSFMVNM